MKISEQFRFGVMDARAGVIHLSGKSFDYDEGYGAQMHLEALQDAGYCLEVDLLAVNRGDNYGS